MPSEESRISFLEAHVGDLGGEISRLRNDIATLMVFMHSWKGGVKAIGILLSFVGCTNLLAVIYLLMRSAK